MKFGINNPAFLQAASNVGGESLLEFMCEKTDVSIQITGNGDIKIESQKDGTKIQQTYSDPMYKIVTIQSDSNTMIRIDGDVTYISINSTDAIYLKTKNNSILSEVECTRNKFTELDLTTSVSLYKLNCRENSMLNTLDVSKNTLLTQLDCASNTALQSIFAIAINESVANEIASAITNADSVDGTVTLRQGDEFNQTIIDAAMDKGWDVQYYS